jgi:hypothetical protein
MLWKSSSVGPDLQIRDLTVNIYIDDGGEIIILTEIPTDRYTKRNSGDIQ